MNGFSRRYSAALREQLAPEADASPRTAGNLGREALAAGLEVLDLLRIHQRALSSLPRPDRTDRAARFLVEALTPIAKTHTAPQERHDYGQLLNGIGQSLTAISVKLTALQKQAAADTTGVTRRITSAQRLVATSMITVHRFARELRPPLLDDVGLIPALRSYMKDFTKQTHIRVHFRAFAAVEQLAGDKRTALFRVTQEAFTDVAARAQATLVDVRILRVGTTHVRMEIHDDGKVAKGDGRPGALGMRERVEMVGGSFSFDSASGRGTTIRAQIPLRSSS